MLALLGAIVAVPVVVLAMRALRELHGRCVGDGEHRSRTSVVDLRVLAATLAMAIGAGIVAGLAPALVGVPRRSRPIAEERRPRRDRDGSGGRFRSALVVAQVALSLTLLVSGGLFVRSLDRARDVDLGFDPDGVFLPSAAPGTPGLRPAQRLDVLRSVRDRIAALPGVEAGGVDLVSAARHHRRPRSRSSPDVRPTDPDWRPRWPSSRDVSPEYFAAARVRLVDGTAVRRARRCRRGCRWSSSTKHWRANSGRGQKPDRAHVDGRRRHVRSRRRRAQRQVQNIGEPPRPAIFRPLAQTARSIGDDGDSHVRARRRDWRGGAAGDAGGRPGRRRSTTCARWRRISTTAARSSPSGWRAFMTESVRRDGHAAGVDRALRDDCVSRRPAHAGDRRAHGARCAGGRHHSRRAGAEADASRCIGVGRSASCSLPRLRQLLRGAAARRQPVRPDHVCGRCWSCSVAICWIASFVPARRATIVDPLIALRAE